MYSYIIGEIKFTKNNYIVLENNNVGYKIYVANPFSYEVSNTYQVYLYNHVREDENSLYGFKDYEELNLFMKLIDVKGVGPKTALPFLATGSVAGIIDAINRENILYLTKFPKIGEKTAKQIILDLKGKLKTDSNILVNDVEEDLINVLENLGYKLSEIKKIISNIDKTLKLEEQIKEALKLLMR